MKLSKNLVVMGLLFSSVLGSANVGNITALAATPQIPDGAIQYVDYRVNYRLYGEILSADTAKSMGLMTSIREMSKMSKLSGKRIVGTLPQNIVLLNNERGLKTYSVVDRSITVDIKEVSLISLPPVEHITDNRRFIKIIFNDSLNDIASMTLDRGNEVNFIGLDEIKLPEGYRLRPNQNLEVQKGIKQNNYFVRLLVQRDFGDNESNIEEPEEQVTEQAYSLKVKHLDKDGKDLIDETLNKEIKIKDNTKPVTADNLEIPEGFKFVSYDEKTGVVVLQKVKELTTVPNKKPVTKPSKPTHHLTQRVRITFVDKNTNELVGNLQLEGSAGLSKTFNAPKNYELVNSKDATIKFDNYGNKDINVYVKKTKSTIIKIEDIVTTKEGEYKRLYTIDGKLIKSRGLAANTKWYTDQKITVGGDLMYRVATNEWVKATDIK